MLSFTQARRCDPAAPVEAEPDPTSTMPAEGGAEDRGVAEPDRSRRDPPPEDDRGAIVVGLVWLVFYLIAIGRQLLSGG